MPPFGVGKEAQATVGNQGGPPAGHAPRVVALQPNDGANGPEISRLTRGLLCLQMLKKCGVVTQSQSRDLKQMLFDKCAPLEAAIEVYQEDNDITEFVHTCYVLLRCTAPSIHTLVALPPAAALITPHPSVFGTPVPQPFKPPQISQHSSNAQPSTTGGFTFGSNASIVSNLFAKPPAVSLTAMGHGVPAVAVQASDLNDHAALERHFSSVATTLLNKTVMQIGGVPHRMAEIEFYLNCSGMPDPYPHSDPLQCTAGHWYFHRMHGTYKGGTFKGLDLTFGAPSVAGGILIRSIQNIHTGEIICGPSLCVGMLHCQIFDPKSADHILSLCKYPTVAALVDGALHGNTSAEESANNKLLYLSVMPSGVVQCAILRSARIGLNMNKGLGAVEKRYVFKPYRYFIKSQGITKGRNLAALYLLATGQPQDVVSKQLFCTQAFVDNIARNFTEGKRQQADKWVGKKFADNGEPTAFGAIYLEDFTCVTAVDSVGGGCLAANESNGVTVAQLDAELDADAAPRSFGGGTESFGGDNPFGSRGRGRGDGRVLRGYRGPLRGAARGGGGFGRGGFSSEGEGEGRGVIYGRGGSRGGFGSRGEGRGVIYGSRGGFGSSISDNDAVQQEAESARSGRGGFSGFTGFGRGGRRGGFAGSHDEGDGEGVGEGDEGRTSFSGGFAVGRGGSLVFRGGRGRGGSGEDGDSSGRGGFSGFGRGGRGGFSTGGFGGGDEDIGTLGRGGSRGGGFGSRGGFGGGVGDDEDNEGGRGRGGIVFARGTRGRRAGRGNY